MKILIVDDYADGAHMLAELLEHQIDANVTTVLSGKLAIEALKGENFDLMICDYHMPEMNGYDVFQVMKAEGFSCRFLLYTNADLDTLPKFEGYSFLGIVKKMDLEKLFGFLERISVKG